ncbi:Uncharacterized protein FWK35_00013676 [Aphis craccivora]|uniref:Uncharacterized protein n=1 Tax=Aphis craccivora TaxID=307492 RepID=A0A6G0YKE8_APHCR|nr:Uncharacterized protein FWK35_00013676 [Aphis craccivora]
MSWTNEHILENCIYINSFACITYDFNPRFMIGHDCISFFADDVGAPFSPNIWAKILLMG